MSQFVTDTHPLIWHLTGDARLASDARMVFVGADQGTHRVWVPGIVLIEMVYLTEKGICPAVHARKITNAPGHPGWQLRRSCARPNRSPVDAPTGALEDDPGAG